MLSLLALLILASCQRPAPITYVENNYYEVVESEDDADTGDTEVWPTEPPFTINTEPSDWGVSPFDHDGVVYWFNVSQEQVELMNVPWYDDWYGELYSPEDDSGTDTTFADNLYVWDMDNAVDFGKVEARIVGQSTWYEWSSATIPNIRVDMDEFQEDLTISGTEHIRFNNNQVGSVFSEAAALATYNALGYPAPRTQYAFVGGSPWLDENLLIPYTAVEVYKRDFCSQHADFFGGGCVNIWEGYSLDVISGWVDGFANACKLKECDETRLREFADVVDTAIYTQDFDEMTADYLDWDTFRRFQCTEWLLWIGDDYLHNYNNIVLTEGEDGLFRFMPYSTDISAGMAWGGAYGYIELYGWSSLATGCQYDEGCWEQTVATCEAVIDEFEAINPAETIIDDLYDRLATTQIPWGDDGGDGMLRSGDESRYAQIRDFYESRASDAREELENYRQPWSYGSWDTGLDTGW